MKILRTGPLDVNTLVVPLCGEYVFVVDSACCDFSGDETVLAEYVRSQNLVPFAAVFTHGHFDHVSGLPSLARSYPGIQIAVHECDSAYLGADSARRQKTDLDALRFSCFLPFVSELPAATAFLADGKTLADVFFQAVSVHPRRSELEPALRKWRVIHTPGHTPGSCCLYNAEDSILISGDTIFFHAFGRTDLPGGAEADLVNSVLKITETCGGECAVYPGHERCGFTLSENTRDF